MTDGEGAPGTAATVGTAVAPQPEPAFEPLREPFPLAPPEALPEAAPPAADEPVQLRRRGPRRIGLRLLILVALTGAAIGVQLSRPVPAPALRLSVAEVSRVAGLVPTLPWPAVGEAAVAVPATGEALQSGPEAPVPMASLAKVMTGDVVLRDHPLGPNFQGPTVVVSPADQAEADAQQAANATSAPVVAGEALSERQLLDGLLVHSANNFADILARWDVGSTAAFVAKMNATAAQLGMRSTRYLDASGLDNGSVATAADQLRVAADAMTNPTFAAIVAQPSVQLPVAGTLANYVKDVGTDGIVGVKSGFTQAAMGCLVLAAERSVAGRNVLVLAAVTGQPAPNPLDVAEHADLQLVDAVAAALHDVDVVAKGSVVGRVTVPWGSRPVRAVAGRGLTLLVWPGQPVDMTVTASRVRAGMVRGDSVGTLSVSVGRHQVLIPVRLTGGLSGPSMRWRLAHG